MKIQTEDAVATVAPQPLDAEPKLAAAAETVNLTRSEAEIGTEKPQIQEELVIEEISIDGMCGVY